jgi:hypothetical protein
VDNGPTSSRFRMIDALPRAEQVAISDRMTIVEKMPPVRAASDPKEITTKWSKARLNFLASAITKSRA